MKLANATLLFLDSALDLRPNRFEELADIILYRSVRIVLVRALLRPWVVDFRIHKGKNKNHDKEQRAHGNLANKKVRSKAAHRKTQLCLRQQSLTPPRRAYAKVEPRFCLLRHLTRLTAMKLSEIVGEIDDSTGNPLLQVFTAPILHLSRFRCSLIWSGIYESDTFA